MPDIDFDELDRAVHDLMRQSGQLPATPDKPSEAPATTPSKDSASSSTQAASSQPTVSAATSARPEVNDDAQDTSTSSAQSDTSTDAAQQADSSDDTALAKQSPAPTPQDDADSTDETVQTDDDTATADANSDTDTNSASARHRGVTIMPLSQQADGAELAGEPYEPVESEPVIDRARALSESVVASEREPASMPATPEQTDTDDTDSARVTPLGTATPAVPTTESVSSQPRPAAVVTVDPDDIITPASDDDESDDAYADRAQFFGRSAARPFFAEPRAVTPVDDVLSTTNSDVSAPLAETDNTALSAQSDGVVSDETPAVATEEEAPATIDQVESETPTMPYQFAGEDAESDDDDDDEALVRHLNEVNRTQDDETEPAQASVVDDLDDAFAPQPLIIPPPKEEESDTSLPSAETVVEPTDDTHTADDAPVAAPQDEPDGITNTSSTDDAGDDHLLYAPETPANTDVSAVLSSSNTSDTETVQPLNQSLNEPAWPELQYDEPDDTPDVQALDGDHTASAWPEVMVENTSAVDDSQTAAQAADVSVPSEYESFDSESSSWVEPTTVPPQPQAGDIASAELLTAEHTMPDVGADNDSPSSQPEEVLAEDTMPEARVDRPLPLLSTYNEHRAAPEPHVDTPPLSDLQEETNAVDATDVAENTNDIAQSTTAMQVSDTLDSQAEQPYAPATPLFAPADDVVAKAQQIIAARPEVSTNDAPTPPQEEEDTPKNAPDVVPITLSQPADQQTELSVADASAMHTADETTPTEPGDDQAAAPAIQRPRGRFMDIVGGAAPVAAAAQTARPRVRRQGVVVEPLTNSAPVVGMDIRPAPGHEPAQHHVGAVQSTPPAGDEVKASDVVTPDGTLSADALDLQPGDEKPLGYTPFLPDAETKVDKRPLGGADTLVGDAPTLADTVPMGMYHDESGALGVTPADNNEPSAPPHLFAPHDEHASAEQFIDALTDTSENAPSLYPADHYPLPEQDTPETATADDEPMYQLEDHYGADQSLYPDEPADSHEASANGAGPQFAEDEIDLSLPVPGPGEPDIDYYGEAERVEAEPMTAATEWDDEPDTSDQAHVNTIEEAAATTQNGDTALALHQALQEENEGNVVAPIYSAEEFTRAPKKSRRRPEQAAGWIWLLWIVMLLALGAGLGAVYYTLFG